VHPKQSWRHPLFKLESTVMCRHPATWCPATINPPPYGSTDLNCHAHAGRAPLLQMLADACPLRASTLSCVVHQQDPSGDGRGAAGHHPPAPSLDPQCLCAPRPLAPTKISKEIHRAQQQPLWTLYACAPGAVHLKRSPATPPDSSKPPTTMRPLYVCVAVRCCAIQTGGCRRRLE
jgi:hypothetical protein